GRHVPLSIEYRQLRQLDAPRMSPPWRFLMGGPAGGGLERALSWLARHAIRSQGPAGRASAGLSDVQEALEGQTAPVGTLLRLEGPACRGQALVSNSGRSSGRPSDLCRDWQGRTLAGTVRPQRHWPPRWRCRMWS